MNYGNKSWNGIFDGLRVPFAINAVLLGILFVALSHGLLSLTTATFDPDLAWSMFNPYAGQICDASVGKHTITSWTITPFRDIAQGLGVWAPEGQDFAHTTLTRNILAWVGLLILWSLFAPAICRVAAMRISRDETISLGEALKFGASKFLTTLLTVVFICVVIFLLWLLISVLGLLSAIPYLGEILLVPAGLFSILVALFALLFAIGQVAGVNLMPAGVAAEGSDGLDGFSRAINYVYARPWHALIHNALILGSVLLLLIFGELFFGLMKCSMTALTDGRNTHAVFNRIETSGADDRGWYVDVIEDYVDPPEESTRSEFVNTYYGSILRKKSDFYTMKVALQEVDGETTRFPLRGPGAMILRFAISPENQPEAANAALTVRRDQINEAGSYSKFWYALWYYLLILVKYVIAGYATAYFFVGTTTSYFLLRKEVDGTDTDEVFFDEDDYDLPPVTEPATPPQSSSKETVEAPSAPPTDEAKPQDAGESTATEAETTGDDEPAAGASQD